jgi:hypothetical protein
MGKIRLNLVIMVIQCLSSNLAPYDVNIISVSGAKYCRCANQSDILCK